MSNMFSIKISMSTNGKQIMGSKILSFYSLDGAIDHFAFLEGFFDLLCAKENSDWGTALSNDALVNRFTDYVRAKVSPISFEEQWGRERIEKLKEGN